MYCHVLLQGIFPIQGLNLCLLWLLNYSRFFINPSHLFQSVQFSHSVVSDSLRPHVQQHARPPCPSPTPRLPESTMSIVSVIPSNHRFLFIPFSSCPQSFPASGPFQTSQLFASGVQILDFQVQHQSYQ